MMTKVMDEDRALTAATAAEPFVEDDADALVAVAWSCVIVTISSAELFGFAPMLTLIPGGDADPPPAISLGQKCFENVDTPFPLTATSETSWEGLDCTLIVNPPTVRLSDIFLVGTNTPGKTELQPPADEASPLLPSVCCDADAASV